MPAAHITFSSHCSRALCACRVRHIRRRPAAVLVSVNSAGMSREALCRNWWIVFTSVFWLTGFDASPRSSPRSRRRGRSRGSLDDCCNLYWRTARSCIQKRPCARASCQPPPKAGLQSRDSSRWTVSDCLTLPCRLNGSVRQKKKTESGKLKAEIGKPQFVSFVSWLFKTRAHAKAVSRLRRATAVQGSAWGGCRRVGGMHPKANGRRRTVGGRGRTVCAFCRWNVSRRRRLVICRSWNGNDNLLSDTSRSRKGVVRSPARYIPTPEGECSVPSQIHHGPGR